MPASRISVANVKITVNGKQTQVTDGLTAEILLEQLGLVGQRLALEINREILPRSAFAQRVLQEDDHVEIIHAVGGG